MSNNLTDKITNNIQKAFTPFGINVAVHVVILATILSLFFMFYISKVAQQVLNTEIINNMDSGIDALNQNVVQRLPQAKLNMITQKMNKFQGSPEVLQTLRKIYSQPDPVITVHNNWLFKTIKMSDGFLYVILGLTLFLIMKNCNKNIPLKEILIVNAITFTFVGIVEYMFFTHVAMNFVPTKPSMIADVFINELQKKL